MSDPKILKPLPRFASDAEAEAFVDDADLTQFDLSGARPAGYEFRNKDTTISMRVSRDLLDAVKALRMISVVIGSISTVVAMGLAFLAGGDDQGAEGIDPQGGAGRHDRGRRRLGDDGGALDHGADREIVPLDHGCRQGLAAEDHLGRCRRV